MYAEDGALYIAAFALEYVHHVTPVGSTTGSGWGPEFG
jgi:hypothetical protein